MSQESEQMDAIVASLERIALAIEQSARSSDDLVTATAEIGLKLIVLDERLTQILEKMPSGV